MNETQEIQNIFFDRMKLLTKETCRSELRLRAW